MSNKMQLLAVAAFCGAALTACVVPDVPATDAVPAAPAEGDAMPAEAAPAPEAEAAAPTPEPAAPVEGEEAAMGPWTPGVDEPSPMPSTLEGWVYRSYEIFKYMSHRDLDEEDPRRIAEPDRWRSVGYVVDMPGFPAPLFSDPDRQDETTAHLTWCDEAIHGAPAYTTTYYYDPTPDADFGDFDTFCGGEEGVTELGGYISLTGDRGAIGDFPGGAAWGMPELPRWQGRAARAAVDRTAVVEGPDGQMVVFPAPVEANRARVFLMDGGRRGDYSIANTFREMWVYDLPAAAAGEAAPEPEAPVAEDEAMPAAPAADEEPADAADGA
jgi:hypothetical protein